MDNAPFSSSPPEHAQKPIATVLVVDDTPDNLTLMGSLLREHFQVKVANHGEKALKIALSDTPPISSCSTSPCRRWMAMKCVGA